MIGIIYSNADDAGANMAAHLAFSYDFEKLEGSEPALYENDYARIYGINSFLPEADFVDSFKCDYAVFLSRHKSEAGIAAFTTHSLGNWTGMAEFGGKPNELSYAAPLLMLSILVNLSKTDVRLEKTYEATHHGPLLKTPCLFVELGGNEQAIGNKEYAEMAADAAFTAIKEADSGASAHKKIVVGIGGTHYPEKFTRLALEKGYAFSHIMPKHAIMNADGTNNLDVLEQALARSAPKPESAVVDWKSLNSVAKELTLKKLEEIGLDYEKI